MLAIVSLLGPILCGLALSALSLREYAFQREVLKGDNKQAGFMVMGSRVIMAFVFSATLTLAAPTLGISAFLCGLLDWSLWILINLTTMHCGLWALIKEKWSHSPVKFFHTTAPQFVDRWIQRIPAPILYYWDKISWAFYEGFGTAWFVAQVILLAAMLFSGNALIGAAGLVFFGLSYLRSKNYLPAIFARALERFSYWMGLMGGIFTESTALKVLAVFSVGHTLAVNMALPKLLARWLGKEAVYLQATRFVEDTRQAPQPLIPRSISLEQMENVVTWFEVRNKEQARQMYGQNLNETRMKLIGQDIILLFKSYDTTKLTPLVDELRNAWAAVPTAFWALFDGYRRFPSNLWTLGGKTITALKNLRLLPPICRALSKGFNVLEAQKPFITTFDHMHDVPDFVPAPGPVDFRVFQRMVVESDRESLIKILKPICLKSPKFHKISRGSYERYNELKKVLDGFSKEQYNNQQLPSLREFEPSRKLLERENETIRSERQHLAVSLERQHLSLQDVQGLLQKEQDKMCAAWKVELRLSDGEATNDDVIYAYALQKRLPDLCAQIETGRDLLWDKMQASLETFQNRAKHVVLHIMKLLSRENKSGIQLSEDVSVAHSMIANLIVDAGDYCANGIYDIVQSLYDQYVLKACIAAYGQHLTDYQKLSYYLQQERQDLFERMYEFFKTEPIIKALFPTIDFSDRHTYSAILQGLTVLRLRGSFNADTDLSNDQMGFSDRLVLQLIVYCLARMFMMVPHGYSPEHITRRTMEAGNGLALFDYQACLGAWIASFQNSSVREYLSDVSQGVQGPHLCAAISALMMFDSHIFSCTAPERMEELKQLLIIREQNPHDTAANTAVTDELGRRKDAVTTVLARRVQQGCKKLLELKNKEATGALSAQQVRDLSSSLDAQVKENKRFWESVEKTVTETELAQAEQYCGIARAPVKPLMEARKSRPDQDSHIISEPSIRDEPRIPRACL